MGGVGTAVASSWEAQPTRPASGQKARQVRREHARVRRGRFPRPGTRALRGRLLRGAGVSGVSSRGGRGRLLGARGGGVDSSLLSSLRG